MVLVVSYTAFKSPFVGDNYTAIIVINSLVLFFSSYYIIGWKSTKKWWREKMREAKYRAEFKMAVRREMEKRLLNN